MAAARRVVELSIGADDLAVLETLARSRTEPASRVERARILLAYRAEPSSTAVGKRMGITHHTVRRCLRRAQRLGVIAALDDSPRPGKAPQITDCSATIKLESARQSECYGRSIGPQRAVAPTIIVVLTAVRCKSWPIRPPPAAAYGIDSGPRRGRHATDRCVADCR